MPAPLKDKRDWIALSMIPGLGNIAFRNLLEKFGTPEAVIKSGFAELSGVEGIKKEVALDITRGNFHCDPDKELSRVRDFGGEIITFNDEAYPLLLKEIHDPPMLLYVKGREIPRNMAFIAIVGSRNATHYGMKAAEKFGQGIARRGLGIVSGMARGIDSASHWGCINGMGHTIAVPGTGIDIIYPESNKKLYNKIIDTGTVISEFPMGTSPMPANFPRRNRLISGMSRGVIVVEATRNSGSLITASLALDHGREIFAVPGSIDSFKSTGCHLLIKQGAMLVENADDVLEGLGLNFSNLEKTDTFRDKEILPENDMEKAVYELVGNYPVHIDEILRQSGLKPGELSGILTMMELKGMLRQLPGKMFVR